MKKTFFLFSLFLFGMQISKADDQVVGIYYIKSMFTHVHQTTNANSVSLTTVACGHPLKVLKTEKTKTITWYYTEVGAHKGYVQEDFTTSTKPDCFQGNYPIFFNGLNLDLSQMYYWGRLNDQYIHVDIKAP
ncbi:MAG: hypothetical protein ACOYL6_01205 [Bacteriovoracaceae bacterium]